MKNLDGKIVELDLNDILPNRFQPRIKFNESGIIELSESIKEHGVIQPIIVRPIGDKYEIVAGERRYKAAVLAGISSIPTIVLDLNDIDTVEIALIENIQRKDLTPIEEAISYKRTLDMGYITQEQLANKLGKSQSAIANKIRLLNLSDEVQEALMEEKISERHARSLLKIEDSEDQVKMLKIVIKQRLTVRKLDEKINEYFEAGKVINSDYEEEKEKTKEQTEEVVVQKNESENKIDSNNENEIENKSKNEIESKDEDIINISDLIDIIELEKRVNEIISNDLDNTEEKENNVVDEKENAPIESKEDNNDLVIEEKDKEIKGENDNMNNMLNIDEEINYNTLKTSSNNTGNGKFLMNVDTKEDDSSNFTQQQSPSEDTSGLNIFNAKLTDLMAPQGSAPVFKSDSSLTQDSIFASQSPFPSNEQSGTSIFTNNTTVTQQQNNNNDNNQSIFSNLINNSNNSNEQVDEAALNNFLDPTFVDGEKQANSTNQSDINSAVFSKFLNTNYNELNTNDANSNVFNQSIQPSNQNNSLENFLKVEPEPNTLQSGLTGNSGVLPANESVESTDAPLQQLPSDSEVPKSIDQLLETENKPDLLAPMGTNNEENANVFNVSPIQQVTNEPVLQPSSELNDTSLSDMNPQFEEKLEPVESDIPENNPSVQQSAFLTASPLDSEVTAPSTPIIEDTQMSRLLSNETTPIPQENLQPQGEVVAPEVQPQSVEESPSHEEVPSTIAEQAQVQTNTNSFLDTANIQPIIITDYDKQYDPVLPPEMAPKKIEVDFKQVLSMIRDLNDKIESFGYTIETDEIDLEDKYQVIFNIEKK